MNRIAGRSLSFVYALGFVVAALLALAITATWKLSADYFQLPAFAAESPPALPIEAPFASQLSFTLEDAVSYFSRAIGEAPRERSSNYAHFEARIPLKISVTRHDSQMLLRLQVEDERGMEVTRNFCKAPFFRTDESDLLQAILSAGEGIHCATSPRFDVLCEYHMEPASTIISFFFSPPIRLCAPASTGL